MSVTSCSTNIRWKCSKWISRLSIAVSRDTRRIRHVADQLPGSHQRPGCFAGALRPNRRPDPSDRGINRDKTPARVRDWVDQLPPWVHVREGEPSRFPTLNYGEAAALALAVDEDAYLLVDDLDA